jgi:hypothetical protein
MHKKKCVSVHGYALLLPLRHTAQEERAMNTFDFVNIVFQVVKFVVEVILKIIELTMKKRE